MKKIKIIDIVIILFSIAGIIYAINEIEGEQRRQLYILLLAGAAAIGLIDLIRNIVKPRKHRKAWDQGILYELLLLDEMDQTIKKWDLKGKISMVIGRANDQEAIDIDLSDSEYDALVDYQHALLNYAAGYWYIEDLYSKNGIRIKKQLDGTCYKLAKDRPCRLDAGDVILIANTKLLFR